jgi:hypothetical protein
MKHSIRRITIDRAPAPPHIIGFPQLWFDFLFSSDTSHRFSVKMGSRILGIVSALAAIETVVLTRFYKDQLPVETLSGCLLLTWSANFLIWAFWTVFIFPFFFSPLRSLPEPPVCDSIMELSRLKLISGD